MKLVIAQGGVKRTIEGPFALCCGLTDMDNLIRELQFVRAGMAATGGTYGWVRIDDSHPSQSAAGPPKAWAEHG